MLSAKISIMLILAMFNGNAPYGNLYAETFVVSEIRESEDVLILTDFCGRQIQYSPVEDWNINDMASCIMFDNGTLEIYDDVPLSVRYTGWLEREDIITSEIGGW